MKIVLIFDKLRNISVGFQGIAMCVRNNFANKEFNIFQRKSTYDHI